MALATKTELVQDFKLDIGQEETPKRLACLGCGNHLDPVQHAKASNGEWVIRSRCPD